MNSDSCLLSLIKYKEKGQAYMATLSIYEKYTIDELSKEIGLSKKVANGIRKYFGEPLSLIELSQITRDEFFSCRGMGLKSWYELKAATSKIELPEKDVKIIGKPGHNRIAVEIDVSKPFNKIIAGLAEIIKDAK